MKLKNIFATSVIVLSTSLWVESAKAFVLIDNFNTGPNPDPLLIPNGGNDITAGRGQTIIESFTGQGSDIIGTVRDIQVSTAATFPQGTSSTINTADLATPSGSFLASRNSGPNTATYSIVWDGTTSASTPPLTVATGGLGSQNLSVGGNNAIRFDIVSFDNITAASTASLTVWSNDGVGGFNTAVNTITNLSSLGIGSDLFFSFADFTGGTVNFADISAIRFDLTLTQSILPGLGAQSSNFGVDQVEAVPIPFEFNPAIGVGLLGLAWGANKFRKAKKAAKK